MNFIKLVLSLFSESANEKQRYMTNSLQKSIKRLSIAILVIGGLTLAYTYFQMIAQFWLKSFINPVVWNPEIRGWQIFMGLACGEIFPRSNIALIRWTALVTVLLTFVRSNYQAAVHGESALMVDSNVILIPLIVLLFAGLYKTAYLAAKDSNLAI